MNWQPFMNKVYLADNVKGCTKVRAARAVRLFSSFNQSDHCVLTFSLPSLSSSHCTGGVWIRTVSSQSLLGELDLDFTAITGLSFFFFISSATSTSETERETSWRQRRRPQYVFSVFHFFQAICKTEMWNWTLFTIVSFFRFRKKCPKNKKQILLPDAKLYLNWFLW